MGGKLRINYDAEEDILYIIIREGPIADSKELDEDVRVEYNLKGGGRDRNNECKKHS
ncbi:MAG: DUF2283 domain-containing protein [Thermoproteota archaeon]